jgi:hypothetical protein
MIPACKPVSTPVDISAAARWIALTPDNRKPRPIVQYLQREFGLTPAQAAEALREAALIRARAH